MAEPATVLSDDDRLKLDVLTLLSKKADKAATPEDRAQAYGEYLKRSSDFLKSHREQTNLWVMRAIAAVDLNRAQEGWEAGQQLKALGLMHSQDPKIRELLAEMELKGWLGAEIKFVQPDQPAHTEAVSDEGEIFGAAKRGDWITVKALLKDHPDLAFRKDDTGATLLHWAADKGQKALAEILLASKSEVNAQTADGRTPLHFAAQSGHEDLTTVLLANQADVNAHSKLGVTPLYYAVSNGHRDVVRLLLASKVDINAKVTGEHGFAPLHIAALNGDKDMAELLLRAGAEVNVKVYNGATPLHFAAQKGYKDVAELLLANNAEVNAKAENGATPLASAELHGHKEVAELLRRHGGHK